MILYDLDKTAKEKTIEELFDNGEEGRDFLARHGEFLNKFKELDIWSTHPSESDMRYYRADMERTQEEFIKEPSLEKRSVLSKRIEAYKEGYEFAKAGKKCFMIHKPIGTNWEIFEGEIIGVFAVDKILEVLSELKEKQISLEGCIACGLA